MVFNYDQYFNLSITDPVLNLGYFSINFKNLRMKIMNWCFLSDQIISIIINFLPKKINLMIHLNYFYLTMILKSFENAFITIVDYWKDN